MPTFPPTIRYRCSNWVFLRTNFSLRPLALRLLSPLFLYFGDVKWESECAKSYFGGICTTRNCSFNHSIFFCRECGASCTDIRTYREHFSSREHQDQLRTSKHPSRTGTRHCACCDQTIYLRSWRTHVDGRLHMRHYGYMPIDLALQEAGRDQHGVFMDGSPIDFGLVDVSKIKGQLRLMKLVRSSAPNSRVVIISCKLLSQINGRYHSGFTLGGDYNGASLVSREPLKIDIIFSPGHRGRFGDRLELHIHSISLDRFYVITLKVMAAVEDKTDYEAPAPVAPYQKNIWKPRALDGEIIPGVKPEAFAMIKWAVKLPMSEIPRNLGQALTSSDDKAVIESLKSSFLPLLFNEENYAKFFKVLLHVEEYRSEQDLQRHDVDDQTLQASAHGRLFFLGVPGLAEKRPSVIMGDRILVRSSGSDPKKWFEGYVHVVERDQVGLQFNQRFSQINGQKHHVRFKLGRLPLRLSREPANPIPESRLALFNRDIETNPPQLNAVKRIMVLPPGSLPFIIFGPPGTGKTETIVETIQQILTSDPDAKLLVCAPSNSASDLIAERLKRLSKTELFRLNAPSRRAELLPRVLLDFSSKNDKGIFNVPEVKKLKTYRVVVSTLISASIPYAIGVPQGHFTHIFIDEAVQAMEPEAMIPIKTLADNNTNVILSGDPKQLGPIIRSGIARELGLSTSYLDRLMTREVYDLKTWSGVTFVKLLKNWRSHNAIMKFSNEKFYGGELQQCGDPAVINSYLKSDILPKKGFPVLFHSISGTNERESKSPSFFNRGEASLVKQYVQQLVDDRSVRISHDDIGIISPYNAQCRKIRQLLRPMAPGIKVGSVEEFQGQERRVIIISTVRSSMDFVKFDIVHTLGFVANPRRFNVAITRTKALLIVIGDPAVLGLDPLWREFLNYIHQNGGWTGRKLDWDPSEPVRPERHAELARGQSEVGMADLVQNLEGLDIGEEGVAMDGNFDKPWREDE